MTPYRDEALRPLTLLMRYQVFPLYDLPAHVTRQLPPVTLLTALTLTSAGRTAARLEMVLALVRSATPSHFVYKRVPPRTFDGVVNAAAANKKVAISNAVMKTTGGATRSGRRDDRCNSDYLFGGFGERRFDAGVRAMTQWAQ